MCIRDRFITDKKHQQIDKALYKLLEKEQKDKIDDIWHLRDLGLSNGLEQYNIPTNLRQAAALWSHDWPRFEAGFEWLASLVDSTKPATVLDVGAGPGFLIGFLSTLFPNISYTGIDLCDNFTKIAEEYLQSPMITGDYLHVIPPSKLELVICNFGFDNTSFTPSDKEHVSAQIGLGDFCVNCSNDLLEQCRPYLAAWKKWSTPNGNLALVGRIVGFGELRAWLLAAAEVGWKLDRQYTSTLRVNSIGGEKEKYPAMLFRPHPEIITESDLDWISHIYVS